MPVDVFSLLNADTPPTVAIGGHADLLDIHHQDRRDAAVRIRCSRPLDRAIWVGVANAHYALPVVIRMATPEPLRRTRLAIELGGQGGQPKWVRDVADRISDTTDAELLEQGFVAVRWAPPALTFVRTGPDVVDPRAWLDGRA